MTVSQLLHINNQFLSAWGPPTPFPHLVVGKGERVGRDQTPPIPGNGGKRWETVGLWEQEPSKTSQEKVEEKNMTTTSTTPTYEYQLAHHFQANYAHQFRHVTNLGWHKLHGNQWQPDTGEAKQAMLNLHADGFANVPDTYQDHAHYYATNLDQALN